MRRLVGLVIVLSLLTCLGQLLTASASEFQDVIVVFKVLPRPETITGLGGTVHRTYSIIPAVSAQIPSHAAKALARHPEVAYVEPNIVFRATAQSVPWGVSHIGAPTVHAGGLKGDGVSVAIVDTGIQLAHPDLVTYGGYNFVADNSNYGDDNGHGTHVAGTVAARDNLLGVLGVAPLARLYGVKVLAADGTGTLDQVISGIQWATTNEIQVINLSLGSPLPSDALAQACVNAYNAGRLLVAAAGNTGQVIPLLDTVNYPANYSSVIAVAAVDANDQRAWWSSTGWAIELSAPGVNIHSTYIGSGYHTMSGTSMACPHVSGVAALVWEKYPGWNNGQVRDRMNATALQLGYLPRHRLEYGNGLVQAIAATQ